MVKNSAGKDGYRSFTIVQVKKHGGCKTKFNGGQYVNKTPNQAARKAFHEHCRRKKVKGQCSLHVVIQETTQGSKKKLYSYKITRVKLAKPVVLGKGDSERKLEYTAKCVAAKVPEKCTHLNAQGHRQTRGRRRYKTRGNRADRGGSRKRLR